MENSKNKHVILEVVYENSSAPKKRIRYVKLDSFGLISRDTLYALLKTGKDDVYLRIDGVDHTKPIFLFDYRDDEGEVIRHPNSILDFGDCLGKVKQPTSVLDLEKIALSHKFVLELVRDQFISDTVINAFHILSYVDDASITKDDQGKWQLTPNGETLLQSLEQKYPSWKHYDPKTDKVVETE